MMCEASSAGKEKENSDHGILSGNGLTKSWDGRDEGEQGGTGGGVDENSDHGTGVLRVVAK